MNRRWGLLAGFLLAGCTLLPSPAPGVYDIQVENGTTLDVEIFVNGDYVGRARAGTAATIASTAANPLPWHVSALTSGSGRELLAFDVEAGSVDVEGDSQQGRGSRVDLSCGRLDVYVGPPMLGPAPGLGILGDCGP